MRKLRKNQSLSYSQFRKGSKYVYYFALTNELVLSGYKHEAGFKVHIGTIANLRLDYIGEL